MQTSSRAFDFHSMAPKLRAIALVGRYLQIFAFMEAEIDDSIAKILGLTNTQAFVLGANLAFHNKINILSTLLDLSYFNETEKKNYTHTLNLMLSYASGERNHIAHVMFSESPQTDGVRFLVVRAKGKLQAPDFDWSIDRFEQSFANLRKCRDSVAEMGAKITKIHTNLAALLAAASVPLAPTAEPTLLSGISLLSRQPPADHKSETTSANPETDPQTPSPPEA